MYEKPSVTVDIILVNKKHEILLIKRGKDPFKDQLALPGGFVNFNEEPLAAACRELKEETGVDIDPIELSLLGVYGKEGRDPRGWTISACYYCITPFELLPVAADDAKAVSWVSLFDVHNLAFDHDQMVLDFWNRRW
jgi:8-oxo-dGTP diphosphatase